MKVTTWQKAFSFEHMNNITYLKQDRHDTCERNRQVNNLAPRGG
jgi:hypothetical protein